MVKSHLPKGHLPRTLGTHYLPLPNWRNPLHAARMPKRDFLAIPDLSKTELSQLFELAGQMKSGKYRNRPLEGQTVLAGVGEHSLNVGIAPRRARRRPSV